MHHDFWSFLIHTNFDQSTGFNDTQHAIIVNISEALIKCGVVIRGACFDGDKCQVKNVCSNFYDRIIYKMNLPTHELVTCMYKEHISNCCQYATVHMLVKELGQQL